MEAMRSVFVGNLAWTTTNDVLTSFLESGAYILLCLFVLSETIPSLLL